MAAVVGSGIMAERLAGGNVALALLANTIATGAALAALVLTFGPISGAHFNPAVSLADALEHGLGWNDAAAYTVAQCLGGIGGAIAAHAMFGLSVISLSQHARSGGAQVFSEFVATFGLLCVIWGCSRTRSSAVPFAVAAYITAAYWFTASTSFAKPGGDHRAVPERQESGRGDMVWFVPRSSPVRSWRRCCFGGSRPGLRADHVVVEREGFALGVR